MKFSIRNLALGGLMTALGLVFMLMAGIFPMAEFALPALAGMLTIVMVVEAGYKWAFTTYLATGLLSIFICPMKECALYYLVLLGFYPIVKSLLEHKAPVREWIGKMLLFNLSAAAIVLAAAFLLRIEDYIWMLSHAWWLFALGWIALNGVFVIYDLALTRLISGYIALLRPRLFGRRR